jgi:hypothetical protein
MFFDCQLGEPVRLSVALDIALREVPAIPEPGDPDIRLALMSGHPDHCFSWRVVEG